MDYQKANFAKKIELEILAYLQHLQYIQPLTRDGSDSDSFPDITRLQLFDHINAKLGAVSCGQFNSILESMQAVGIVVLHSAQWANGPLLPRVRLGHQMFLRIKRDREAVRAAARKGPNTGRKTEAVAPETAVRS